MDLYSWENKLQISNGRFSIAMFDCWRLIKKEGSNWSNTLPEDMVNETVQALEMLRNRGIKSRESFKNERFRRTKVGFNNGLGLVGYWYWVKFWSSLMPKLRWIFSPWMHIHWSIECLVMIPCYRSSFDGTFKNQYNHQYQIFFSKNFTCS